MAKKDIKYCDLVKEMRKYWNIRRMIKNFPGALILSLWISPYLSAWAIKKNVKPDTLTRAMIPSAIIGSMLLMIPLLRVKILGALIVHLFFAIDLCDGQVARSTKTFSDYGEQLDHLAHHCSHFFLIIAVSINLLQLNRYDIKLVIFITGIMLFAEYSYRDVCAISTEINLVDKIKGFSKNDCNIKQEKLYLKIFEWLKCLLFWFRCVDNYVLFACVCLFIDMFVGTNIVIILSYIFISSSILKNVYDSFKMIRYTAR